MAPALAAAIFIVGFGGGIGATYNFLASGAVTVYVTSSIANPMAAILRRFNLLESSAIAGIRSVTQEPGSNQVSIKYDTIPTQEAQGSLNDQRIQQLLLVCGAQQLQLGCADGLG